MLSRVATNGKGILLILFLWECAIQLFAPHSQFLKAPSATLQALPYLVENDIFGLAAKTLMRSLVGTLVALTIGVPIGAIAGEYARVRSWVEPTAHALRAIPSVALIPIITATPLGGDWFAAQYVIVFGSLWPMLQGALDGVSGISLGTREAIRQLHLSPFSRFAWILVPSALPSILTGMKSSVAISLILAITCELLSTGSAIGLGTLLNRAPGEARYDAMYGLVMIIGAIGLLINLLLSVGERLLLRYRQ